MKDKGGPGIGMFLFGRLWVVVEVCLPGTRSLVALPGSRRPLHAVGKGLLGLSCFSSER